MQHRSLRGEVVVDTSKFESWPLLRPDELTRLPTEVLRASVSDLDTMCQQASGDDPVAGYARIQRERTSAVLSERAAQARVQALLAGTEFVGRERLETAPSHDDAWSTHQPVSTNHAVGNFGDRGGVHRTLSATTKQPPSREGSSTKTEEEAQDVCAQDVRSPPRLQPSSFGQPTVSIAATAAATTAAVAEPDRESLVASSLGNEQNRLKEDGGRITGYAPGKDGRGTIDREVGEGQPTVSTRLSWKEGSGFCGRDSDQGAPAIPAQAAGASGGETEPIRPREPKGFYNGPHKVSGRAPNVALPTPETITTGAERQHDNQRGSGRAAPDNAIRDNWGSVFVVGGGRRRRRPPVKQRSAELEDTPAARRAQVEKERQERRKASLRRLMARKEQRALQQEARRKRRAAAARKAAAAAAAVAAAAVAAAAAAAAGPAPAPPAAIAATPDIEAEPASAAQPGARGSRKGSEGLQGRERESLAGVQGSRGNVVEVGSENVDGSSRLITAQHEHRSEQGGGVGSEGGARIDSSAPQAVSLTSKTVKEGSSPTAFAASMMGSSIPEQGGDGAFRGGLGGGGSGSSESESVSGGDSSDDDDLFMEELEEDCTETPKGGVSSDNNGKTTVQAQEGLAKGAFVQQDVLRASEGADEAAPAPDATYKGPLMHANEVDVVDAEVARDGHGRAEAVPKTHIPQQQSAAALPESGVFPGAISSSGTHTGLTGGIGADGGIGVVDGDGDGDVGEGTKAEASAASDGAADATGVIIDDSAVPEDDDSDSELEWEDEGVGASEKKGVVDDSGGGDAVELPGPLDVQPVAEIEAELGQGGISTTTKGRVTGLLPADLSSPLAAGNSGLREQALPPPAPLSLSPQPSVAQISRHPRRAAADQKSGDDPGMRVSGVLGDVEQRTKATPLSSPETAATHSEEGIDAGLSVAPPRGSVCARPVPSPTKPAPGKPRSNLEANDDGGEAEVCTDLEAVGARVPARGTQDTRADRPAKISSDVDWYVTGSSHNRSTTTSTKDDSANFNTVDNTAAYTSPRQRPYQEPLASPHGRPVRNESPPPNLQALGGNAENSGRGSFTARGKEAVRTADMPKSSGRTLARYSDCYPRFAAILSAHHNGRALTRQADCRSLPLTSRIMSRGRNGTAAGGAGSGSRSGLTAAEEEACLRWQWKLYSIHVRVIKDYAAVFSYGDGWSVNPTADDSNSLVYSGDASALHYRVNSKARPEVYNIVTDVLNNRCEQWEELPTGLGLKTTWNLLWTWSKPHIQYSSLLTWQKVNHFPNSRELTRKDLLNKHISRFMAPGGRLAKEFHIMPQTFVLPHEFTLFVSAFTASGRSQKGGRGRVDSASCNQEGSTDDDGVDGLSDIEDNIENAQGRGRSRSGKGKNLWIMKPVGMSRGRGIRLIDDIKNISYADKVVLQRYVGNPLLLDGYKFDLRLYVLVTSFNKLEAFIYKEGFARLSTHRYEKGDIDNRFIHLTNSSIQRLNETGAAQDSPLHHAKTSEAGGTKTTLSYLWRRLAASGVDVGALWAGICSVIVKSLVCVEGSIPNQSNSFELFGYDVLIDDRLRPWLIEVNSSPSMARDTHVDRQVKEALIFETIHLVDPLPFDRQKLVDILGKRLSENESSKARPFKQHHHPQQQQRRARPPEPGGDAHEAGHHSARGQSSTGTGDQHDRPRRSKEERELDRDLDSILCGRRPRRVGEPPARMGNFVRLCPGTAAHRHARRLRRRVIRPRPGDDDEPPAAKP